MKSKALALMPETRETREMKKSDILVLDYQRKAILVYDEDQLELISQQTQVDMHSIICSLVDHEDRLESDEIYVVNGYTFIQVRDFARHPIQASWGSENPSIRSSVDLWHYYVVVTMYKAAFAELLDIEDGSIRRFFNLLSAIRSVEVSFYDILKVPLKAHREVTNVEHYVFPVVYDSYIFRLRAHPVPWSEYTALSLEDFEAVELIHEDQKRLALGKLMEQEEAEANAQFEKDHTEIQKIRVNLLDSHPDGLGKHIEVYVGEGECVTESEITQRWSYNDVLFFITYEGRRYLFILGSDLTCGPIDRLENKIFTVDNVQIIVNDCMYWIDQAFEYLRMDKSKATFHLVGIKDPAIAVASV